MISLSEANSFLLVSSAIETILTTNLNLMAVLKLWLNLC